MSSSAFHLMASQDVMVIVLQVGMSLDERL